MWVCINDAFLSIVHKDCARDELLVRARRAGDIEKIFPGAEVKIDLLADYLYRAVVKRLDVEGAMIGEVQRITYPNFKDSVSDGPLHNAYLRVWTAMAGLQPRSLSLTGSRDSIDEPFTEIPFGPIDGANDDAPAATRAEVDLMVKNLREIRRMASEWGADGCATHAFLALGRFNETREIGKNFDRRPPPKKRRKRRSIKRGK